MAQRKTTIKRRPHSLQSFSAVVSKGFLSKRDIHVKSSLIAGPRIAMEMSRPREASIELPKLAEDAVRLTGISYQYPHAKAPAINHFFSGLIRSVKSIGIGKSSTYKSRSVSKIPLARYHAYVFKQCPGTVGSQSLCIGVQLNVIDGTVNISQAVTSACPTYIAILKPRM